MPGNVALVVPDGPYLSSVTTFLDVLDLCREYNEHIQGLSGRRTYWYDVGVVSWPELHTGLTIGSRVLPVTPMANDLFCKLVLVVGARIRSPACVDELLFNQRPLVAWLKAQHEKGAYMAASGSGVCLLAEAGILAERRAAVPHILERYVEDRYPTVAIDRAPKVVAHGRVFTAATIASDVPLVLALIAAAISVNLTGYVAKLLDVDVSSNVPIVKPVERPILDSVVAKAQWWMRYHHSEGIDIEDAARYCAVDPRTLRRRFVAATGVKPSEYLMTLRLESSKRMLRNTDYSFEEIVDRIGYSSVSHFRAVFHRKVGISPLRYRELQRLQRV